MPEFPAPIRLPGEPPLPREPYGPSHGHESPAVVDEAVDVFGAEAAAADLAERLERLAPGAARLGAHGRPLLSPPFDPVHTRGP